MNDQSKPFNNRLCFGSRFQQPVRFPFPQEIAETMENEPILKDFEQASWLCWDRPGSTGLGHTHIISYNHTYYICIHVTDCSFWTFHLVEPDDSVKASILVGWVFCIIIVIYIYIILGAFHPRLWFWAILYPKDDTLNWATCFVCMMSFDVDDKWTKRCMYV